MVRKVTLKKSRGRLVREKGVLKKKGDSNNKTSSRGVTLKYSSINPDTGKVTSVDSGIPITQKKSSGNRSGVYINNKKIEGIEKVQDFSPMKVRLRELKTTKKKILSADDKSKGTFTAPKRVTLFQKIRRKITPSKTDSQVTRGVKGATEFFVGGFQDIIKGAGVGAKAIVGDKTAKAQINNFKEDLSASAIGIGMGRMVQSADPYLKSQGLLGIGSIFIGFKTPTVSSKVSTSKSSYVFTQTSSSTSKIKISTKGSFSNGKSFTQQTKLTQKGKDVIGTSKITTGGKTKTKSIKLKDEGGYYVDKKTGKRIDKEFGKPKEVSYTIKKIITSKTKQKDRKTTNTSGELRTVGKRQVVTKTTKGKISNNKKQEVTKTRSSKIDFAVDKKGKPVDVKSIKGLFSVQAKKSRTKKQLELDKKKLDRFLEAIDYDKGIIQGIDKRTRLARVLGLSKSGAKFKTIEKGINKGLEFEKKTTIKVKAIGTIIKKKTKSGQTIAKKMGKKASLNQVKPLSKTKKKELLTVPKTINIPKLKSKIETLKSFKARGLLPKVATEKKIVAIENKIKTLDKTREQIKDPQKVQNRSQKKIPATKTPNKGKSANKKNTKTTRQIKPIITKPKIVKTSKKTKKPKTVKKPKKRTKKVSVEKRVTLKINAGKKLVQKTVKTAKRKAEGILLSTPGKQKAKIKTNKKIKKVGKKKKGIKYVVGKKKKVLTLIEKSKPKKKKVKLVTKKKKKSPSVKKTKVVKFKKKKKSSNKASKKKTSSKTVSRVSFSPKGVKKLNKSPMKMKSKKKSTTRKQKYKVKKTKTLKRKKSKK